MTTTHPSPLVEGPYATYDLPTTSILWAAAMVNFKTSPTDSQTEQRHSGVEVSTEKSKIMANSTNISADISMNGQKKEKRQSKKLLNSVRSICMSVACILLGLPKCIVIRR